MKIQVHPLQDDRKPHGKIEFIHGGANMTYSFCVNRMSGDMLDWFNNDPPKVNRTIGRIKKIIESIKQDSDGVVSEYTKY